MDIWITPYDLLLRPYKRVGILSLQLMYMIRKSPEYLDFLVDNDGMKRKLRSALEAVKEGWNSELPFHVKSF